MSLNFVLKISSFKDNMAYIRDISINFGKKFNRKKCHNSLVVRDQTQVTINILKALHVCLN